MLDDRERVFMQLGVGGEVKVGDEDRIYGESEAGREDISGGENGVSDSGQTEWPDATAAATAPYPHFVCGGSVSEKLQELAAAMPSAEILGDLADLYRNFGDSTRLSILSALRVNELCVSDLAELLSMTPSAISHQLRSLRDHNLIRYRREGKTVTYSLVDEHVELMIDMGLEHLMELE